MTLDKASLRQKVIDAATPKLAKDGNMRWEYETWYKNKVTFSSNPSGAAGLLVDKVCFGESMMKLDFLERFKCVACLLSLIEKGEPIIDVTADYPDETTGDFKKFGIDDMFTSFFGPNSVDKKDGPFWDFLKPDGSTDGGSFSWSEIADKKTNLMPLAFEGIDKSSEKMILVAFKSKLDDHSWTIDYQTKGVDVSKKDDDVIKTPVYYSVGMLEKQILGKVKAGGFKLEIKYA